MAKPINIEIAGIPEVKKFINDKSINATKQMTHGLALAAIFMQGEVKDSIAGRRAEHISVDTGRFLNSIGIAKTKNDAVVFSALSYARKLEFGFKNFTGRRHFRNSKERNQVKARDIIAKEMNKI